MRIQIIISAIILNGCAGQSLEEMRDQAMITGDWSAVEKREARIEERLKWERAALACKEQNKTLYCEHRGKRDIRNCGCVDRADLRRLF
jgi:hypothetical protein